MICARRLRWFGSRCCTTTNAMPVLAGNALKNSVYASNPPADAPIATTGKESICAAAFDAASAPAGEDAARSEEHTSELQSHLNLVCRLLLEKKNTHTQGH